MTAPWLQIKNKKMFICATNGEIAAIVEILGDDRVKKMADGHAYLPIFEKSGSINIGESETTIVLEYNQHQGVYRQGKGTPPNVFQLVESANKNRTKSYTESNINGKYLIAGAKLLGAVFPERDYEDNSSIELVPVANAQQFYPLILQQENLSYQAMIFIQPLTRY